MKAIKVLFLLLVLVVGYFAVSSRMEAYLAESLALNGQMKVQREAQKEQIDFMTEEITRREASIKALLAEKLEAEGKYFMISHFPFPGEPWTIEKYWVQEELWIALQSYSSRTAAEDVKAQLESGGLKTRDLFR